MKFQSKWRNAAYVIRKSQKIIYPGLGAEIKWGLIAKFRGPQRLFDSMAAQIEHDWTDEEREIVENKLLGHRDFGSGLYLAPGEILPEEKVEFVKNKSVLVRTKTRCQNIETIGMDIQQCRNDAAVGNEFCDLHRRDNPQILKGMLTTTGSTESDKAAASAVAVADPEEDDPD